MINHKWGSIDPYSDLMSILFEAILNYDDSSKIYFLLYLRRNLPLWVLYRARKLSYIREKSFTDSSREFFYQRKNRSAKCYYDNKEDGWLDVLLLVRNNMGEEWADLLFLKCLCQLHPSELCIIFGTSLSAMQSRTNKMLARLSTMVDINLLID
jgi:hypothetical protein